MKHTRTLHLTHKRLLEILHYDPETGIFTWRIDKSSNKKSGDRAGDVFTKREGYRCRRITVDGKRYYEHRLAHFYMTGEQDFGVINHINENPEDNRWCNLQEGTQSDNMQAWWDNRKSS